MVERIKDNDIGTYASLTGAIKELEENFRELPSAKLFGFPPVDSIITLPPTCFILQAATVQIAEGTRNTSMYVDSEIWHGMNSDQQTGLILHEALKLVLGPVDANLELTELSVAEPISPSFNESDSSPIVTQINRSQFNQQNFRAWHIELVAADGFVTKARLDYIDRVRHLGQRNYLVNLRLFSLDYELRFHDTEGTQVAAGYLLRSQDSQLSGIKTSFFQNIDHLGKISFHKNGGVDRLFTGHVSRWTNDFPSDFSEFDIWKTLEGKDFFVAEYVAFDELGHIIRLDAGHYKDGIKIKTEKVDVVSMPLDEQYGYAGSVHSFGIEKSILTSCLSCKGSVTIGRAQLSFSESLFRFDTAAKVTTVTAKSYDQKIAVKLSDSVNVSAHEVTYNEAGFKSLSANGYLVVCENQQRINFYKIALNSAGELTEIDEKARTDCKNFTFVKGYGLSPN